MSELRIKTAEVFEPLLEPARYKGAHGGRGSGKSHFFAELGVEDALRWPGDAGEGLRLLSYREIQKSLKQSAKFLIEKKIKEMGLGEADGFKSYADKTALPGDGVIEYTGMQDHTADSIKSYEGFHRAWGEESHTITSHSLSLLRPTIRWEDKGRGLISEMWNSWNPRHKRDAIDQLLRGESLPTGATVVAANWSDNPWFPDVLQQERLDCLKNDPDNYMHIWEGEYATIIDGAYFARLLAQAKNQGRIGRVGEDPLMAKYAIWDIGGTGAKADATAIWIVQFIGREIRILNYYEAQGQPLATHIAWLRENGYQKAECVLPHDGDTNDKVYDVSFKSALEAAEYSVTVIPNQGKGAAKMRIEAVRRIMPLVWFNEETTEAGRDALAWYHEKKDEDRNIGLGPEHDWSSHGADAFGLMAVFFEGRSETQEDPVFQRRKVV